MRTNLSLGAVISWLVAHGAPQPEFKATMAYYPGGSYTDYQLVFRKPGTTPDPNASPFGNSDLNSLSLSAEIVTWSLWSPSMALGELQQLGLAPGDPKVLVPFSVLPSAAGLAAAKAVEPQIPADSREAFVMGLV